MKKVFDYFVYIFAIIGFSLVVVYFAVEFGLTKEDGVIDNQRKSFIKPPKDDSNINQKINGHSWAKTEEWKVLREAIIRDRESIYKASALLDVKPRLIVSIVMVEQMRLFYDNREIFKTIFAPLKILVSQSKFSWGVVGIKEETAIETERNLKSTSSPFYIGKQYESLLDFSTDNQDRERFMRITDEHNRYYSYLYTATLIKELETQWKNSGYNISNKPEIIATLFNIGFSHSKPNATPKSGGASIWLDNKEYSFGGLAGEFYNSEELVDYFPK